MKKGFTLIELLAVIVILAIIAVIAVPIVLNIINEVKDNSAKRSVDFYMDAVEQAVARKNLTTYFMPEKCEIQSDGNLICDGKDELVIEVNGEKPTEGTITFKKGSIENYRNLKVNNKYASMGKDGASIADEYKKICVPAEEPLYGNVPTRGSYNVGDEYICEVGPEEYYNFIIMKVENNDIALIALENIGTSPWVTKEDFLAAGGSLTDWNATAADYPNSYGKYTYGPVTAIKFLNEKTKNWVNVDNLDEDYIDYEGHYTMHLTGKARIPSTNDPLYEIASTLEEYLDTNWYGGDFYLMDSAPKKAWEESLGCSEAYECASTYGDLFVVGGYYYSSTSYGIRPVIKMQKEDFEIMYTFGEYTCVPAKGEDLEFTYTLEDGEKTDKYTTGTKSIGDAYRCKVNDNETYVFNVIGKNGDNVDLMINYNIITSVWNSEFGHGYPEPVFDDSKPTPLLQNLKSLTDTWINIDTRSDSITMNLAATYCEGDCLDYEYDEIDYTINYTGYRARLPEYNEMNNAIKNNLNMWYLSNLDNNVNIYWLISDFDHYFPINSFIKFGYMSNKGLINDGVYYLNDTDGDFFGKLNGVRPVITVPSSKIK